MKLVDILARELKVWPEGVRAITQGGGSGVLRDEEFREIRPSTYLMIADDSGDPAVKCNNSASSSVTRAQWQAAVDALKADEYHEPDNGVEAWLHGIERDYGNDAAQQCRVIIIEAELKRARSKACDNMFGVILSLPEDRQNNRSDICEALYDAGYRKFEIVDN